MTNQLHSIKREHSFTLAAIHPSFDDYDVVSATGVHRFCVPQNIKHGEQFNVYGPGSRKSSATWRGTPQASLDAYLNTLDCTQETVMTVYAVAVESDACGLVDWFSQEPAAAAAYDKFVERFNETPCRITLFSLPVPQSAPAEAVTDLVDAAMWEEEYVLIKQCRTPGG